MAYTSISNVSVFLRTTIDANSTPNATTVTEWISEVDDEINRVTKQKFETTTVTDYIMPLNSDTTEVSASSYDYTGILDYPAPRDYIKLPHSNILSITSVYYNTKTDAETPDWTELTVGYGGDVILQNDRIALINTGLQLIGKKVGLKVSYTYGEASVPKYVQKVATRMVALQFLQSSMSSEVTSGGGSIRVGDIQISEPGTFTQSYIDSLEEWVDLQLKKLGTNNVYVI